MSKGKHQIRHVLRAVGATPWAITAEKFAEIDEFLTLRKQGHLDDDEIEARLAAFAGPRREDTEAAEPYEVVDGVAIVSLEGTIAPKMNILMRVSGGTSTHLFGQAMDQAADSDVSGIVIAGDSHGGNVIGAQEAADRVRAAAARKPVVCVVTGHLCSAAYVIGSAADRIVASPSSLIGSLGVFSVHTETSEAARQAGVKRTVISAGKFKVDGNETEPLTAQAAASWQERIDDYYAAMVDTVARNMGVSAEHVEANFGQGKAMIASKALAAGLIHSVGTLQESVAELAAGNGDAASAGQPATPYGNSHAEGVTMDQRVMKALQGMKLIDGNATAEVAEGVLTGRRRRNRRRSQRRHLARRMPKDPKDGTGRWSDEASRRRHGVDSGGRRTGRRSHRRGDQEGHRRGKRSYPRYPSDRQDDGCRRSRPR